MILSIESLCDDSAIAITEIEHSIYGGVVLDGSLEFCEMPKSVDDVFALDKEVKGSL